MILYNSNPSYEARPYWQAWTHTQLMVGVSYSSPDIFNTNMHILVLNFAMVALMFAWPIRSFQGTTVNPIER